MKLIQFPRTSLVLLAASLCVATVTCTREPADRQKLADAISKEDVAAFTAEMNKGFSADQENSSDGKVDLALIHLAADCDSTDFVRLLLDHGVKVDLRTSHGETPLVLAAGFGKTNVVRFLLDHGAQIDAGADSRLGTPLMAASREGHLDIVKLLVERGASVNAGGLINTPLYLAAAGGHRDVVEYLMSKGATSNMMMTKAVEEKHPDMAKLIAKADVVTAHNARVRAIMAEADDIQRKTAALVKHSQETGEPIDKTKLEQYQKRAMQLQQQMNQLQ